MDVGESLYIVECHSILSLLAVAGSMLLCWIFYRVRTRQCEAVLLEVARTLEDVRRTAEALKTRRRIVRVATLAAEKALMEYNIFLKMLQHVQKGNCLQPDLPILRHQIEIETMRAQVSMVRGCLLAMSREVLSLGALPASEHKQDDVLTSFDNQQKSYVHMSEELLTLLGNRSSESVELFSVGEEDIRHRQPVIA